MPRKRKKIKSLESKRWGWAGFFTHIHHAEENPIEWSDNIHERFIFMEAKKSDYELPLRTTLIFRVPDSLLPKVALEYLKTFELLQEAKERYQNVYAVYQDTDVDDNRAENAYEKAQSLVEDLQEKLENLDEKVSNISLVTWERIHRKVCHPRCPWNEERDNIFDRGYSLRVLRK